MSALPNSTPHADARVERRASRSSSRLAPGGRERYAAQTRDRAPPTDGIRMFKRIGLDDREGEACPGSFSPIRECALRLGTRPATEGGRLC